MKELLTKELSFRGVPFKIAHYDQPGFQHPSWFMFEDETSVRDETWLISPGDWVFDVGAMYGSYTMTALASGADRVFAWALEGRGDGELDEPSLLMESAKLNGWEEKVEVFNTGLYSRTGLLDVMSLAFSDNLGVRPSDGPVFRVDTLDYWLEKLKKSHDFSVPRQYWMKLDVEGAEDQVLNGATAFLRELRPKVQIENHLFKDPSIDQRVRTIMTVSGYREISTKPYHGVSHSVYYPE